MNGGAGQGGFRPGEDLVPGEFIDDFQAERVTDAPVELSFTPASEAGGTDLDVLMGYQVFLGRDPESSFVIADAKTSPVGAFIRALMASGEFQSAVLDRLATIRALPHEAASLAPSPEQVDWVFRQIRLPAAEEAALRAAPAWRDWLRRLVAVPGFPNSPERAGVAAAESGLAAQPADDGFVLVHIEHPKAGERLQPGTAIAGSGWAIAPADVAAVSVHLDDTLLTHARYGLPRPDVARSFPHFRHVDHCGFAFNADIPGNVRLSAASRLVVTVQSVRGEIGRKWVRMQVPAELVDPDDAGPAGAWPIRLALDEATVDSSRILRVRGWAVSHMPLRTVTATLADLALGDMQHGLPRDDIARMHADYGNADRSGLALVHRLPDDLPAGPSFIRVQAEDALGQTRHATLPVTLPWTGGAPAGTDAATVAMRVEVDCPALSGEAAQAPVRGALNIEGWAIAPHGVSGVSVFCGDSFLGEAHLGMRRADIGAAFADCEGALLSGYALVLPPGTLPAGEHRLRVVATARAARRSAEPVTASRSFLVTVEPHAALPRGAALRMRVSPAEVSQGLALLARLDVAPDFDIAILGAEQDGQGPIAETLASLRAQAYPRWRATVMLPSRAAAAVPELRALLDSDAAGRISADWPGKATRASRGKIAVATGSRWALRLRPGDRLGADALLTLALEASRAGGTDFLYADELRPDAGQGRVQPFQKPDWSPELLLGMNYVGRAWCAGAALMARSALAPDCADYDAVLRLTERAGAIGHVAKVLFDCGASADPPGAEAAALAGCLGRRGVAGQVEPGPVPGTWRVRRQPVRLKPTSGETAGIAGRVSVVMPTCAARGLVRTALATIRATCTTREDGGPVEIVVLDNTPARERATRKWLRATADTVIDMPGPFNWSRFNNVGARAATGDVLLFLNDDMEAGEPGWLAAMLEQVRRAEVGVVGARLLYPDGKVQHGGQYLAQSHARHAFRFADAVSPGPFGLAQVAREVISVTGACLMVRADIFDRLGGFDEAHGVVNNDLDFCLKSWRAGLSVVFTPHATLVHHELASRAGLEDSFDVARFGDAWRGRFLRGDPFRNPGMAPESDHYAPDPEPLAALHAGRRGPDIGEVRRILAVKLDHIGDFLTAVPALRRLAARFPAARIDLLCPAATAALARQEAAVADVVVFDFFHARSGEGRREVGDAALAALRARLAPAGYDMAIDLRMQPETREVMRHTGARFLVGYDHDDRFGFLDVALAWEGDRRLAAKRAHISERLIELVSAAEDACRVEPDTSAPAALPAGAVPALATLPAAFLARPLVCVHPGVGNAVRQWPAAYYAVLIDLLAAEGFHAVLIGGAEEAGIGDEVLRLVRMPGVAESLVGRARLSELADVLLACVLFVGNNSGPQHLAASLGMPTLGIHSGVVDAAEWAPRGARAMAMQRRMVCGPCYLEFASDCPRDLACLTGIRPGDVLAACLRLLGRPAVGSAGAASSPAGNVKLLVR